MQRELFASAVVVVAKSFNPSVVSQVWLVRNGLLGQDELPTNSGSVFADALVQVFAPRYTLLVTPEQLQFVPSQQENQPDRLILEKVGRLVETLPHTPFRAIGLNFTWHTTPLEDDQARELERKLFYRTGSHLYQLFDTQDAHFGAYFSKNFLKFRLKLDVRPVTGQMQDGSSKQFLQMQFNYHADIEVGEAAVSTIQELLSCWGQVSDEARRLVDVILGGELP